MKGSARDLSKHARELRQHGNVLEAANAYTAAAYEYAGAVEEHVFPGTDETVSAVGELLNAATCYRIAGDEFRTQNRCDAGILLAEDYINYIETESDTEDSFAAFRRGAWSEFIGDLRTVAGRDSASTAYDEAVSIYEAAGGEQFTFGEKSTCD